MTDIYGTNGNAIAMGNARRQQVRELNERIQQHNTDIANSISDQLDQKRTTEKIRDAQQAAQAAWTGSHMPDKIKKFNEWRTAREAKANPIANEASQQAERVSQAGPPADAAAPKPEAPATSTLKEVEPGIFEEEAAEGLKSTSALKEGAVQALGKAAKVGGGIMAAATGGMDIYEDIKADGIAGNNNWEKAGNLLQIGGSVADVAGTFFPPAALVGGVLDLASMASTGIGEELEEDKEDEQEKQDVQKEQVQQVAAPVQQTVATGRVS